jgi:hypothetical protein
MAWPSFPQRGRTGEVLRGVLIRSAGGRPAVGSAGRAG